MMPKSANADLVSELIYSTHRDDPANARYLVPLENKAEEAEAQELAGIVYSSRARRFSPDVTEAECDYVFEQCLIDMRRMLCDPDYSRILDPERS